MQYLSDMSAVPEHAASVEASSMASRLLIIEWLSSATATQGLDLRLHIVLNAFCRGVTMGCPACRAPCIIESRVCSNTDRTQVTSPSHQLHRSHNTCSSRICNVYPVQLSFLLQPRQLARHRRLCVMITVAKRTQTSDVSPLRTTASPASLARSAPST